ncbi:MAG TPA: TRAP transporter large permease [Paenalcaligenes hominis]|uniref:TRAP transporter large permease protein n=1 Tax=Paenalcaligenes hominis TaxID=643674 RepID=A0A9D2VEB7_9BURK|nr:TRAP transporter large permease [Paenalcaligenes hominis]NJB65452.1 tripartite ATP-independent transporter DctM subunit [Paenalcaligenes hominis]GGE65773.1 tripartite transporter large subunit [Paenalcaligenes hominis]HJH23350.1 TRAP transporter large permease [Paenalcaligenes hominis]
MEWQSALLLMLGALFFFMAMGTPVVFAFLAVNLIGAWVFLGQEAGLAQWVRNTTSSVTSFALTPIPLFVLMGEVLFHTGLAFKAINAIERLISRVPGKLSIVSILGGTTFATLSGSSIANTAMMGGVMMPEMQRRGYHPTMSMGPIMAVGGIAMLIPPSALAVMLGSLAGISIERLLIGGILPGLIMAAGFLGYVIIRSRLRPQDAPSTPEDENPVQGWEKWKPFFSDVVPLLGIFIAVVGSMLAGWASPTESAAIGVTASVIATCFYRALTWKALWTSLIETAKVSVVILFILAASTTFAQLLSFSGASAGFLGLVKSMGLNPAILVISMLLILLVLGMVLDQVSMMMIALPFFMPLAHAAGVEPVWLGVMILIALEIGLLTPPFGLLLIVMQSVAPSSIRLPQIYRAAVPFLVIEILVLVLVFTVPWLAVGLPNLIR